MLLGEEIPTTLLTVSSETLKLARSSAVFVNTNFLVEVLASSGLGAGSGSGSGSSSAGDSAELPQSSPAHWTQNSM